MIRILIIEDETKVANHLKEGLEEQGYHAEVSYDGELGLRLFQQHEFDMVLIDAILPGINGFELCKRIRSINQDTKLIMLTALGTTEDKIEGLDSGADDYMVKPFDFRELLARIRSLSKRANTYHQNPELALGDLSLDTQLKVAFRGEKRIDLTAKEYALLEYLLKHKGKVLSRLEITEEVWDLDFDPGTNVVDVYMNILRKKIDKDHSPKLIHTRIGMGYYMNEGD